MGADVLLAAVGYHTLALGSGAAALPDNGIVDRPACPPIPDDGGFALVGDADSRHLGGGYPAFPQHPGHYLGLRANDFLRIVLHIAGLGIDLREFLLSGSHRMLAGVEKDGARAGGTLVQGENVGLTRHEGPSFL